MSITADFSYLRALSCPLCAKEFSVDTASETCTECASPLITQYDLPVLARHINRDDFSGRPRGMWRWHELLPARAMHQCITLGEGDTPLLTLPRIAETLGLQNLYLKDEGLNPGGTIYARALATVFGAARALGLRALNFPPESVDASALTLYTARAGMRAESDSPHAGEPYRLDGLKTIAYEIAESFAWNLPDVILCPAGRGAALVALWKGFDELEALDWLESAKRPRLVWTLEENAPVLDEHPLLARTLEESNGTRVTVSEASVGAARRTLAHSEGIFVTPQGASTLAGLMQLRADKWLHPEESIVLVNSGMGLKSL
jgi:threonine synthase